MANKDNKNDDMKEFEEEFDFESSEAKEDALGIEEEEEALATPKETPNRPAATPGIQLDRKPSKLPLLIGLTIVGFIGWQGYKMLFSSPSNDEIAVPTLKESHPPVAIAPAAAPPKTSIPVAAPTPVTPPPEALAPAPTAPKTPDLFSAAPHPVAAVPAAAPTAATPPAPPPAHTPNKLEALEESLKKSQEKMAKLDTKLSELMDAIGSLNQGMGQVTRNLSNIGDSVQKLNKDFKELKSQAPASAPAPLTEQKYEPNAATSGQINSSANNNNISVHAIIPGRAWLKSKDGTTLTVTEGDSLERYGKVLVIDASNGVVITSSGITLR